jgi:hypothetical protein
MNAHLNPRSEARAVRSPIGTNVGQLVAWQFSRPGHNEGEFSIPRGIVRRIFVEHGFAGALGDRRADIEVALLQATRQGVTRGAVAGHGYFSEPFKQVDKGLPMAVGVYVQLVEGSENEVWPCGARVRINAATGTCFADDPIDGAANPKAIMVAQDIARRANALTDTVTNNELSEAIRAAGESCYWAPFRKTGGVYWMPDCEASRRYCQLLLNLEKLGNFFPVIQPLAIDAGGLTVRNVSMAAEDALLREIADLDAELVKAKDAGKEIRESTVAKRLERCQGLMVQAESYRAILEGRVDELKVAIKATYEKFGEAIGKVGDDSAFEGF